MSFVSQDGPYEITGHTVKQYVLFFQAVQPKSLLLPAGRILVTVRC